MDEENRHVWETNRTRKKKPKQGLFWCDRCDANMVGSGEKCEVCGLRNGTKTLKKEG